jgi:hypothetical protein
MAYPYRRPNGRVEIREARSTPRGPRSRTLASFRGALTAEVLDLAESLASRGFDRAGVVRRARELGIPVRADRADAPARALISSLRGGASLDPRLAGLLREQLDGTPAEPLPEALADVAEWVGASEFERGRALRDVLRLYGSIAQARAPVRVAESQRFPRFASRPEREAS